MRELGRRLVRQEGLPKFEPVDLTLAMLMEEGGWASLWRSGLVGLAWSAVVRHRLLRALPAAAEPAAGDERQARRLQHCGSPSASAADAPPDCRAPASRLPCR